MGISEEIEVATIAAHETTVLPNPGDWNDKRTAIPIKADNVGRVMGANKSSKKCAARYKQKISENNLWKIYLSFPSLSSWLVVLQPVRHSH